MKNRRIVRFFALAMSLILVLPALIGCSNKEPASKEGGSSNQSAAEISDEISLQLFVEPVNFDPQVSNTAFDMAVMYQIYDNLFEIINGDYNNIQPSLCERYEMSEDAKEFTFYLREGVKWHNGDDFTADDVVFSINRMIASPQTSSRVNFINNVEKVDDYTVKCYLDIPCARLPALLSTAAMSIVNKRVVEEHGDGSEGMIVGTGAYKLESWTPGQGAELTAFDEGWRGAPAIKTIKYNVITDQTAARIAFQNREIDMYNAQSIEDYDLFSNKENIVTEEFYLGTTDNLAFNVNHPLLKDIRIRKAIAHAIDKEALNLAVSENLYKTANSIVPQGCQGYIEDVPEYEYNPEKAKELLKEAGYSGEPIRLLYTTAGRSIPWATTVQAYLAEVGINVQMEGQEYANVVQRVTDKDFDMCMFEFGMNYANPVTSYYSLFHNEGYYNIFNYSDDEVDRLLIEAYSTPDIEEQTKLLESINRKTLEECIYVPNFQLGGYRFYPSNLEQNTKHEPAFNWVKVCYFTWDN